MIWGKVLYRYEFFMMRWTGKVLQKFTKNFPKICFFLEKHLKIIFPLKLLETLLTRGYELIKFLWWFIILGLRAAVYNKLTRIIARILFKKSLHERCSVPIGMALFSLVRNNNLQNNFRYNNTTFIMRALMVLMKCKIRKFYFIFGGKKYSILYAAFYLCTFHNEFIYKWWLYVNKKGKKALQTCVIA